MSVRRSITVSEAAEIISASVQTINRMLENGEIEGDYLRRERRVYLDSLATYQDRHAIKPRQAAPARMDRQPETRQTDARRILKEFGV